MSFTHYDSPPAQEVRTLTNDQKIALLDAFAVGMKPMKAKHTLGIDKHLIKEIFALLEKIDEYAKMSMSGTVTDTIDDEGVITYLPKVTTQQGLIDGCVEEFGFAGIMPAILTKLVQYSKTSGNGTWAFYLSQF